MERVRLIGVTKRFSRGIGPSLARALPKRHRAPSEWFLALDQVDLEIPAAGTRLGIIGGNGSGKTTLLRVIAGVTRPTYGIVEIQGRVVPMLEMVAGMHPDLTGRENIFLNGTLLGMRRREIRQKFDSIVRFAEVKDFLDMPLKHYSPGMTMRLGFSVAVHVDAEIFLVDEAWSIGDTSFQAKSFDQIRKMQTRGVTTLLVSHDLEVVRKLTDETIWLRSGCVAARGPTESVIQAYLKQASHPHEK